MNDEIAFELILLDQMSEEYQKLVLDKIGMTREQAEEIRRRSPLQYPNLFMKPIESFDGVLVPAPAELSRHVDRRSSQFYEAALHPFLLTLWPHLLWVVGVVHAGTRQLTCGGEFQHKTPVDSKSFDPSNLQPGQWCRHTLEKFADSSSFVDGWDEQIVLHMQFQKRSYEGEFVFGLLQSWKPLAE